jgi:hypothetical protein
VKKTYNPYAFQKEKRILLAAWANFLTGAGESRAEALGTQDAIDVEYREVQPPPLEAPKPLPKPKLVAPKWAEAAGAELAQLPLGGKAMFYTVELLLAIVTHQGVPSAIKSMVGRGKDFYTAEFFESGPPEAEIGAYVAESVLRTALALGLRDLTEKYRRGVRGDTLVSAGERAEIVRKALKDKLAKVYVRPADTIVTAIANAVVDASLTRWSLRKRKKLEMALAACGSNPEPVGGGNAISRLVSAPPGADQPGGPMVPAEGPGGAPEFL